MDSLCSVLYSFERLSVSDSYIYLPFDHVYIRDNAVFVEFVNRGLSLPFSNFVINTFVKFSVLLSSSGNYKDPLHIIA